MPCREWFTVFPSMKQSFVYKALFWGSPVIDDDGYRPNVGIVICNRQGQVMWARRFGQHSPQFPQGGINPGESAEQAMYRELFEEVGLSRKDVRILASTRNWLRYKLPKRLVRWDTKPVCIGQNKMVSLAAGERRCRNQYANQQYTRVWRLAMGKLLVSSQTGGVI